MPALRFGILGTANIARSIVPAMREALGLEPVAVASRDPEKARAFGEEFKLEPVEGYQALLDRKDIDAVYIPLPDGLHEEWAVKAARAGKHVLCEKTLATSFASAQKMVAAARQNRVRLMEAFMFRFHAQHEQARLMVKHELGGPLAYRGRFGFHLEDPGNVRLQKALGGGSLHDVGCYTLCGARVVLGMEPIAATADLFVDPARGVDVYGSVMLEFGQGVCGHLSFGFRNAYANTYEVWAGQGTVILPRAFPCGPETVIRIQPEKGDEREIAVKSPQQQVAMLEAFAQEVYKAGSAPFDFEEDALAQAKAMEAIRVSAREKRRVELEEII